MLKNVQFQRWFFEKFSGGIAPKPPYWGGATAPLPRPHRPRRSGASRLSRLARDIRSLHRQAVIWDDFRHTNPEMLPAPLRVSWALAQISCNICYQIGVFFIGRCALVGSRQHRTRYDDHWPAPSLAFVPERCRLQKQLGQLRTAFTY